MDRIKERVEQANQTAIARLLASQPRLVDIAQASEVISNFQGKKILHAGPPIRWREMCGPMRGGIWGATVYEGWADSVEEAERLVDEGTVALEPCHHHSCVGSMTGITSPSMWVYVVQDMVHGKRSYSHLYEGRGTSLAFGGYGKETLQRLEWMRNILGPALRDAVRETGGVALKPLIAQGLQMGDECHNRNIATSLLMHSALLPGLIEAGYSGQDLKNISTHLLASGSNFFLTLGMAACKTMAEAAHNVPCSTLVTALSRNGVTFGIRVSGLGDRWFEGPANPVQGLYFPGYSNEDANLDMGDSAIIETCGLGGFAMAASPAIVQLVGGSVATAVEHVRRMQEITAAKHPDFTIPYLDFEGSPVGIDIRLVIKTNILPIINTGISHKNPGIGHIGAGLVEPPPECFTKAIRAFGEKYLA